MQKLKFSLTTVVTLAISIILLCLNSTHTQAESNASSSNPPITIVIRGTSRSTNLARIFPLLPSFIPSKFLTPEGFLPITALRETSRFYKLAHGLSQADPANFPLEHCFFFGWSGKASRKARRAAAQTLCYHIKKLKQNPLYKNSLVRVITHSHGGNLALSLALHCKQETTHLVDQLILLACPVQDATESYLNSHVFKQVISIYTTGDLIQIIDPQGLYNREARTFFSRRIFKPVHSKLKQVCVTYRKKSLGHMTFVESWFSQFIPQIISEATAVSADNQHFIEVDICPPLKKSHRKAKRASRTRSKSSKVITITEKLR